MRVLVTGGRDFRDAWSMREELSRLIEQCAQMEDVVTIVHGDASGADQFAECVGRLLDLDTEAHPADWDKIGKRAGVMRNQEMLDTGVDLVLAFKGGYGTADMVSRARKAGVEVRSVTS